MTVTPMQIAPVTLTGHHVQLVPLSEAHLPRAIELAAGTEIFRWFPTIIRTADDMRAYFADAFKQRDAGGQLPFSTFDRAAGQLVGGSRYLAIDRPNRHLEIGSTWIAPTHQRTHVNTEAKLLMLEHAFEQLGCLRVEFKTDSLNQPSRTALARLGAKEEGIFRNHMVTSSGRIRHSVWFSIIDSEWPQVKADLQAKLERGGTQRQQQQQ